MAEPKKMETEARVKIEPVFKNRTKIDQVLYDRSNSAVTIRPGKTVTGEWFRKYTGKRNSPMRQTDDPDIKEENILANQDSVTTDEVDLPDDGENTLTDKNTLPDSKGNSLHSNDDTKGKVAKDDKNKRRVDSKSKK